MDCNGLGLNGDFLRPKGTTLDATIKPHQLRNSIPTKIRIPSISPPFGSSCRVTYMIQGNFWQKKGMDKTFPWMKNCLSLFFLIFWLAKCALVHSINMHPGASKQALLVIIVKFFPFIALGPILVVGILREYSCVWKLWHVVPWVFKILNFFYWNLQNLFMES